MRRFNRGLVASLAVAAMLLLTPALTSAHEHRDVANGQYSMVVGFMTEPTYTGFLNGLSLEVSDNSQATPPTDGGEPEGAPVEGLEESLQAEIIYGDQKLALTLEPRFGQPGAYDAWVVPMAAGDYSFHIFGTINGTQVDETFTSGPDTFDSVVDQATIQFPNQANGSSTANAPVFGTVSGGGIDPGNAGALAIGIVVGAVGLAVYQRRRRAVSPRLAAKAGIGD